MAEEQVRGRERKQRILDAGLVVFSRKGYRASAVDDIAAESETSKGGVYFHFPNKESIFLALLEQMGNMLLRKVEEAMLGEPDPVARGDVALCTVLETFGQHRSLARLFLVEAMGAGREFNAAMLDQHTRFAALIKRHLDDAVSRNAIPPARRRHRKRGLVRGGQRSYDSLVVHRPSRAAGRRLSHAACLIGAKRRRP
ncbi:MAG TPA: helix-turn-helix domain-containing protein [Dehalococcoidia bacterium]